MNRSHLRILVVEDDPVIAEDLVLTLQSLGYATAGKVKSAAEALHFLENYLPDLVLLDIHLGDGRDGIFVANHINREYRIPFLFLTSFSDPSTLQEVKQTLPAGFVLKPFDENRLRVAIELAFHQYYAVIRTQWAHLEDISRKLPEPLTPRELELLQLLCEGKSNQELADALFVSINTVKTHLKNLYLKLGVESRAEAMARVMT